MNHMVSGKQFHTIRLENGCKKKKQFLHFWRRVHSNKKTVDKEKKRKGEGEGEILLFTFQGGTDQSQTGRSSASVIITGDICDHVYGFFDGTSHTETSRSHRLSFMSSTPDGTSVSPPPPPPRLHSSSQTAVCLSACQQDVRCSSAFVMVDCSVTHTRMGWW